jgi:hypothetical protein
MKYRVFIIERCGRWQNAIKIKRKSRYIGDHIKIISYDKDEFNSYDNVGYDRDVELLKNKKEVIREINRFVGLSRRFNDDEFKISNSYITMFKYNTKLLDDFEEVESNFTNYKIGDDDYKINKRVYNKELGCIDLYVDHMKSIGVKSDVEMDNMIKNAYREWIESRGDYSKKNKENIIYFKNDERSIIEKIKDFLR